MHIESLQDNSTKLISSKLSQESSLGNPMMPGTVQGDPFDGSAEPTVFMSDNRMPVMIEFNSILIYIIFITLIATLLFILPGVRRTKLTSFLVLVTLLATGASIMLAIDGSSWLTGTLQIYDVQYSALTSETLTGRLDVDIGLSSANVTLVGRLTGFRGEKRSSINYNERFHWDQPSRMADEHLDALRKGLPYPILTVTEFLSQDAEGFNWTRQLRQAGFYATITLYLSLAAWFLTAIIMCALPAYMPHMMQITGALIMGSVTIYTILIQSPRSFAIQLSGTPIEFAFGYSYVSTFVSGALSMFIGVLLLALQVHNRHAQFTIMDSESHVQDQKILYGSNITNHSVNAKLHFARSGKVSSVEKNSVIIPIADIEENFERK